MRVLSSLLPYLATYPSLTSAATEQTSSTPSNHPPIDISPPSGLTNTIVQQTYDFTKSYPRLSSTISLTNTGKTPHNAYYLTFPTAIFPKIGGLQAKEKALQERAHVECPLPSPPAETQHCAILFAKPLLPNEKLTLQVAFTLNDDLIPIPKSIPQTNGKQYLTSTLPLYFPSPYPTSKLTTTLRFPNGDIPDYTIISDPSKSSHEFPDTRGKELTYGPFSDIPPDTTREVSVRYEYTHPLAAFPSLERNIEISHYGGNIAFEEHYTLTNYAAELAKLFSRTEFQKANMLAGQMDLPTTALKGLGIPLPVGTISAYFTDDIGNVSTSRFRSSERESMFELRPRFPLFGGWKYKFRIGWDNELSRFLRADFSASNGWILKVPFLEGPRNPEGAQYGDVRINVILPEGASGVEFAVPRELEASVMGSEMGMHRTFLDSVGRTKLSIRARNLNDEMAGKELVVRYQLSRLAALRKPVNVVVFVAAVLVGGTVLGRMDYSIGGREP